MAQFVVLKRNYTRSRNQLVSLEPVILELKNVLVENCTDELVESTKFSLDHFKTKLDVFVQNRNLLEADVEDEAELGNLITVEHEEFFNKLELLVLQIEGIIKEFENKRLRENELSRENLDRVEREYQRERDALKDQMEMKEIEERNDREEREHRFRMEELDLRRLEIQRLTESCPPNNSNINGSSNLPKICLIQFAGELEKYQEFSDNFMSLIDSRTDLADNVKLHYLKGQLTGKASSLIEGLRITNDNYKVAMDILKEEYGTPQLIHNKIYHQIDKLHLRSYRTEEIENFYRKIELNLKLLENQGVDVNTNNLLSSILFRKLPHKLQEKLVEEGGPEINVRDIRNQIMMELRKSRLLQTLNPDSDKPSKVVSSEHIRFNTPNKYSNESQGRPKIPRYTTEAMVSVNKSPPTNYERKQCVFCNGDHYEDQCSKYGTVEARRQQLGNRCYICLSSGHLAKFCNLNYYRCWHCTKFKDHHRALCPSKYSESHNSDIDKGRTRLTASSRPSPTVSITKKQAGIGNSGNSRNDKNDTVISAVSSCAMNTDVYMQTAVLQVKARDSEETILVRAILDTASSHSYVSEKLQKLLGLETGKAVPMNVYTFGALEPKRMKAPEVSLDIITSETAYKLKLFVVPNIVSADNKRTYNQEFLNKLNEDYTLADIFLLENPAQEFDILLGVDYYAQFFLPEKFQVKDNLFLYNTVFGHVLSGTMSVLVNKEEQHIARSSLFTRTEICLDPGQDVTKLWDLDTIGIKDRCSISNDDLALQSFEATLKYEDKRYYVDFPWKNDSRDVQSNYGLAVGRLKSLIRRHSDDGILKVCEDTLTEQLRNGILEEVPNEELDKSSCFFPFHAIIKDSSNCTTKVRFVMDASARQNRSKPSLNDLLYRGPVLLENLCSLLLRFRLPKYGLIADIEKAFLNIGLNKCERDYTRILWLRDVTKPVSPDNILILRHARLPFGVVSSPFLLSGVIRTHLAKYPDNPVVEQLRHNIYMDNILCGVNCESDIENFVGIARKVFSDASLNLREWASNYSINLSPELVNTNRVQNTLGMLWDTQEDMLSLKFNYQLEEAVICKRLLLSVLASFFDILGLWTPIIMPLKLLVQGAWIQKKEWDDELESHNKSDFLKILNSMNYVQNIRISRYLDAIDANGNTYYELHSFSDACNYSYASVVFLRSVSSLGKITSNIVFAKSRVAPTDKPTLPRLELLGALIAYRSLKFVKEALHLEIANCYLWSDNQCVLHWLTGNKVLPTFINNRVKEIKSAPFPITYKYIPTDSNPADIACRGCSAFDLVENMLWWRGPKFLSTSIVPDFDFPTTSSYEEAAEDQVQEINLVSKSDESSQLFSPFNIDERKYGSFRKLINVTCYVKKFINLCRRRIELKGPISLVEYRDSKVEWLKYVQAKHFSSTIKLLSQGKSDQISLQLGLELNQDGLLICKGRFKELMYEGKKVFPVFLPRNCHLTEIIVNDVHHACFHSGTGQTLATLRLDYWLTQGRSEVKKILRNCVNCKKFRQGPYKQPEFCFYPNYRVQRNVAFQYSSVDMFGPMTVQEGKKLISVHGLIFVCMTTRAIHIELLDSENTTDYLLAFKRFLARRNVCKQILSDNAIQFKLLNNVFNTVYNNEVSSYLNQKGIKFTYTSPLSPWEGGLYERLIGSTKQCLRKTLGHLLLSKTQLNTILIEIENVINSRPLGYVGDEEMMITPNHFLGTKSDSLGPEQFEYDSRGKSMTFKNLVDLWKKGNSYLNLFWKTWVHQYLNALRERRQVSFKQGRTSKLEPRIGEVVLIKDTNLNRFNWPYGTIVKLNRGRDDKVRNVDVRTTTGRIITRSISILYPLEI